MQFNPRKATIGAILLVAFIALFPLWHAANEEARQRRATNLEEQIAEWGDPQVVTITARGPAFSDGFNFYQQVSLKYDEDFAGPAEAILPYDDAQRTGRFSVNFRNGSPSDTWVDDYASDDSAYWHYLRTYHPIDMLIQGKSIWLLIVLAGAALVLASMFVPTSVGRRSAIAA